MTSSSIPTRFGIAFALAVAAVSCTASAQPVEPVTAGWQVRQDAESCRAVRTFGTGADRVVLGLRSFGPGSAIDLTVASAGLPDDPFTAREVVLSWDDERQETRLVGMLGAAGALPTLTVQLASREVSAFYKGLAEHTVAYVTPIDPYAQTVRLQIPGAAPIALRTESLQIPLGQLMQCESGLLDKWGFGKDYAERIASGPVLIAPAELEHLLYYPTPALLNHVGGLLQLRLKIDEEGRVADCTAQEAPGTSFGAENCRSLRRHARFTPARDRTGQAVESFAQLSITFARFD